MPPDVPHMTPEEFRRRGREAVDWVADYLEGIEAYPVLSQVAPGEVRSRLPTHPPEHGEPFADVMRDLDEVVMPGITHWQSPNFFAFFAGNSSAPSVIGELLSAGLGAQGMLWATSPAATELETHVLDWLAEMTGIPPRFTSAGPGGGVIQDTASSSTLTAVVAARERATSLASNSAGLRGPLTSYASSHAHSSVDKAVRIAGLGSDHLRKIDVDAGYAMRPAALDAAIAADKAAGLTPCVVTATVGTTSSLAMDPVRAVGEVCRRHGVWLHVDAAWAGTAALCPEHRHFLDGLELADSYVFNPHKWMLVNVECSAFYVADRRHLIDTMSVLPEYLRNPATESGEVFDYRDWHVPLGRRFRALKVWMVIRHYGVAGLRAMVREHVRLGQELARWVREHPDFELAAPAHLNLVCFRHRGGDEASAAVLEEINASGRAYLTHTRLDDRYVIRVNVGQSYTEERHVRALWEQVTKAAAAIGG